MVKFELASRSDDLKWFQLTTYLADANDHIMELGEIWISRSRELSVWFQQGRDSMAWLVPEQFNLEPTAYSLIVSFEEDLSLVEAEPMSRNADAMNFGEEITGELADASDVDWYKISVAGAGTLTLDRVMSGKEGELEWRVHLYREGEFDWSNPEWMMGHRNWSSGSKTYELGRGWNLLP